jgi:hypothetical protein
MKEMPLNKAFSDALRKLGEDLNMQNVARQLDVLQRTVVEFHEAGIPVTLTVRADKNGLLPVFGDHADGRILANGAIETGDARLDFVIQMAAYRDDKMELIVCRDGRKMLDRVWVCEDSSWQDDEPDDGDWDPWGDKRRKAEEHKAKDLGSALSELIIAFKAKSDFIARYNVGPNGVSGTAIDKPFSVAPPLKLKKPEQP